MATLTKAARNFATTKPRVPATAFRTFSSSVTRRDTVPFKVSGQGQGVVAQLVTVPGDKTHLFNVDTYPAFGGKDAHPSPLAYNLAALSSCTQVTGSIVAKDHGIDLKQWNVEVEGQLDPSVLVGGAEGNGNWKSINLNVQLETDVDQAKFDHFASEVERRCPVTQLFKQSGVEWTSSWVKK